MVHLGPCCTAWREHNSSGGAKGSTLPTGNKHLFANLLLFTIGEGGKATSLSFAVCYITIEASSMLLEVLIASLLPTSGSKKETNFLMANSSP